MEAKYFILFREFFGHPQALDAVLQKGRSGWGLSTGLNSLAQYTDSYYESTEELEAELKKSGFVEVPEKAFYAATTENWKLYAYRQYVNSEAYLKQLMDWSGYEGAPVVQTENPISPESEAIIDSAERRAVSFGDDTFNDNCLIFPQYGNVVATQAIDGKIRPYWNSVVAAGKDVPVAIDATELAEYAPLMAHIGVNDSGRVLSYFHDED